MSVIFYYEENKFVNDLFETGKGNIKNHFILLFPLLCSECSINWGLASVLYTQCSCREREPLSIYYSAALHDPPFSI